MGTCRISCIDGVAVNVFRDTVGNGNFIRLVNNSNITFACYDTIPPLCSLSELTVSIIPVRTLYFKNGVYYINRRFALSEGDRKFFGVPDCHRSWKDIGSEKDISETLDVLFSKYNPYPKRDPISMNSVQSD